MRFVIDANNAIGAVGLAFCLGIGWTAGCWLTKKLLAIIDR